MIHPSTLIQRVNPQIGLGVYADSFIPKGTVVYVKDPLEVEVAPDSPLLLDPLAWPVIDRYSYRDDRGYRIISWDAGKHVNHCCEPNSLTTGYGFEIATRDIQPGEELTDDYGLFNLDWHFPCACGSPRCRGIVGHHDFDDRVDEWDAAIKPALEAFDKVKQPLLPWIDQSTLRALRRYLKTGQGYRSVMRAKCTLAETTITNQIQADYQTASVQAPMPRRNGHNGQHRRMRSA